MRAGDPRAIRSNDVQQRQAASRKVDRLTSELTSYRLFTHYYYRVFLQAGSCKDATPRKRYRSLDGREPQFFRSGRLDFFYSSSALSGGSDSVPLPPQRIQRRAFSGFRHAN